MWEKTEPTRVIYRAGRHANRGSTTLPYTISVDAAGGSAGWQLACQLDCGPQEENHAHGAAKFQIRPLSAKTIPKLSESYIRGQDLVLSYAQQETDPFGLSIQVTPIECGERLTIIQLTISLHTDLLDSHPSIEISAAAGARGELTAKPPAVVGPRQLSEAPQVSEALTPKCYAAVVLSPRDQAAADDRSDSDALRVQLFGSFLEKGVIRKSRPWLAIWRGGPPELSEIGAVYQRLCRTPLPLTT